MQEERTTPEWGSENQINFQLSKKSLRHKKQQKKQSHDLSANELQEVINPSHQY